MRWMVVAAGVVAVVSLTQVGTLHPMSGEPQLAAGCQVVLFHSALGVRRGVQEWARMLASHGHDVATPDFFQGRTFDDFEEALEEVETRGGIPAYMEWTAGVGSGLHGPVVFMGFSNGAGSAQYPAATYPEAAGAVLMHGALPLQAFGVDSWPVDVPVQVHYADGDPFRNPEAVEALEASVRAAGGSFDLFRYALEAHLFADPDLAEYDAAASRLMAERALRFLESRCRESARPE